MASASNTKRSIADNTIDFRKKAKFTTRKQCTVCATTNPVLKTSPASCHSYHKTNEERACGECWEAYLSMAVEEVGAEEIECMFCTNPMPEAEVKRLSRVQTGERYDAKLYHRTKQTCQVRCSGSRVLRADGMPQRSESDNSFLFILQDHDREARRVFGCKFCNFATCTVCDRPEHSGETCEAYQSRTGMQEDLPTVQQSGGRLIKRDAIKNCPNCDVYWMLGDGGCGYVKCNACQFRFCQRCLVPWVGSGSAYLVGREAHGIDDTDGKVCSYRYRATVSGHALQNRFEKMGEEEEKVAG
ncbi:hypothetical protein B0A55_06489 [Friedmanniomyces simplex]|uniref:RING-type domain-containing protein n=1 Tax=Friedmanniomyces simplex TaxID=329884 RepID=A0A4U0XAH2_9PEZI|nr:hypothetical protein B0A55_06489 [Friedmanniomyces simplex]